MHIVCLTIAIYVCYSEPLMFTLEDRTESGFYVIGVGLCTVFGVGFLLDFGFIQKLLTSM